MISGKNILQTDFEEKIILARKYMAEKVSALKRNIYFGLLCWKKILHRQVVNVRKKNDITKGLGKKHFTSIGNQFL